MMNIIDRLVKLIKIQDNMKILSKKDKRDFEKIQRKINKIENMELQTIK